MNSNMESSKKVVLIKMRNKDGGLEHVIGEVRRSGFKISNLSARISFDGSVFYLTFEVSGDGSSMVLSRELEGVDYVKSLDIEDLGTREIEWRKEESRMVGLRSSL